MLIYIFLSIWYLNWVLSFNFITNRSQFPLYRSSKFLTEAKSSYTGVGAKVAKKVKSQFRLKTDTQVRSLRKALKKFKRKEQKRVVKARINTLKSQLNTIPGSDPSYSVAPTSKSSSTSQTSKRINKIFDVPSPKKGIKKTNKKIGPKPVRLGISLDIAADLYSGSSLLNDFDPHHRKIVTLNFVGSYLHTTTLPSLNLPEICLVGRSNVGKSSFINSLMSYIKNKSRDCDHAFVSKTPGYTKSINIFEALDSKNRGVLSLVDLPGYGFAKIKNKEVRKNMQSILKAYLKRRNELKLVLFLVDGSNEPSDDDYEVLQYFREKEIPYIFILTKMDRVNIPKTPGQILAFRQYFDLKNPLPIPFSKFGGGDLGAIWRGIFDACTDKFDLSKLNISDKFNLDSQQSSSTDFSKFIDSQKKISIKDLRKLIFKNFDSLPESVKMMDIESMDRDQLLDVLKLEADRKYELERKPLDLVQLKHKLNKS